MSLERALELWHAMPFVCHSGCGGWAGGPITCDDPLSKQMGEELLACLPRGHALHSLWVEVKEASRDPGIVWDEDGEPDEMPDGPGASYIATCQEFRVALGKQVEIDNRRPTKSNPRSPADWRMILKAHGQADSESTWRRFRDNYKGEQLPNSRLWTFPLSELKQAGITVPEMG